MKINNYKIRILLLSVFALSLLLNSCGGGSGGSQLPAKPAPEPPLWRDVVWNITPLG